jgi:hypothetical protein
MRTLNVIICFLLYLTTSAQTPVEVLIFDKLNQERISKKLLALTWDSCEYDEARSTFEANGTDSSVNSTLDTSMQFAAFAGLCGDYLQLNLIYDGGLLDTCCLHLLIDSAFNDFDPEEGELVYKPSSKSGACYLGKQIQYIPNPEKQSSIKAFQIWKLIIILGVSY